MSTTDMYQHIFNWPLFLVLLFHSFVLVAAADVPATCRMHLNPNLLVVRPSSRTETLSNNTLINVGETIEYRCADHWHFNHTILPTNARKKVTNYCMSNAIGAEWRNPVPTCERHCSPSTLDSTIATVLCDYKNSQVPCAAATRPGTTALFICKIGFRSSPNATDGHHQLSNGWTTMQCMPTGQWSGTTPNCTQFCGRVGSETGVVFVVGGKKTLNTQVPWNVGIYSDTKLTNRFEQICGGTILTNRLVLSAAHCFWEQPHGNESGRFHGAHHFRVGAGKYYRLWNAPEDRPSQRMLVRELHSPGNYTDSAGNYTSDLMILVLSELIVFHDHVTPICLPTAINGSTYPTVGMDAQVSGWGKDDPKGLSSVSLKSIDLPIVAKDTCLIEMPPKFRQFIIADKICAGVMNQKAGVCMGDSGAGLISFDYDANRDKIHRIDGVVSLGVNDDDSCDVNKYAMFTNVRMYLPWIWSVINNDDDAIVYNRCDSAVLHGHTTDVTCWLHDREMSCAGNLPNGTLAIMTCKHLYDNTVQRYQELHCGRDGTWSGPPMHCTQQCGRTTDDDAQPADLARLPWHVSIYSDLVVSGTFQQICGGTLVTDRLVITSNSCLRDTQKAVLPAKHFRVATSKYKLQYDDPVDRNLGNKTAVQEIVLPGNKRKLLVDDIALLVLVDFVTFSENVMPICLPALRGDSVIQPTINGGITGRTVAWEMRRSSGQLDARLNVIDMVTVSKDTCERYAGAHKLYLSTNKFCALITTPDQHMCHGESGGGLVAWQKSTSGRWAYHLVGVMSWRLVDRRHWICENVVTVFTNVEMFSKFIADTIMGM